ncbi:response regulator transcription factor [Desertibaculum subflavum]|uniref:response regulator transcription factor n=1 Tax=Desertibaculum subflavum TaxID=2268458 RepID=UPI0034D23981
MSDNLETALPVIVVDDDPLLVRTLAGNLEDAGIRTRTFTEGSAAVDWFNHGGRAAAVMLDWHMPALDGMAVLRRLRTAGIESPILFLTGHSQPIYEEAALGGGAVDFIDKSKSFSIILQRLRLALGRGGAAAITVMSEPAPVGDQALTLDVASARAFWCGRQVDLTIGEFRVVRLLAERAGRDVSYREIYDSVRGEGFLAGSGEEGYRANVRAMVKRIRQKFRGVDEKFDALANYPGFGYRWLENADG